VSHVRRAHRGRADGRRHRLVASGGRHRARLTWRIRSGRDGWVAGGARGVRTPRLGDGTRGVHASSGRRTTVARRSLRARRRRLVARPHRRDPRDHIGVVPPPSEQPAPRPGGPARDADRIPLLSAW
jgi:hypothetical protein